MDVRVHFSDCFKYHIPARTGSEQVLAFAFHVGLRDHCHVLHAVLHLRLATRIDLECVWRGGGSQRWIATNKIYTQVARMIKCPSVRAYVQIFWRSSAGVSYPCYTTKGQHAHLDAPQAAALPRARPSQKFQRFFLFETGGQETRDPESDFDLEKLAVLVVEPSATPGG